MRETWSRETWLFYGLMVLALIQVVAWADFQIHEARIAKLEGAVLSCVVQPPMGECLVEDIPAGSEGGL